MRASPTLAGTRTELQRVATHVLARRRHDVTGKLGLRATPGGFGTPAFGADVEVLRISGTALVREVGGESERRSLHGSSLADLAQVAQVDLAAAFSAGADTPPVGDVDAPLSVDAVHARTLAGWFALGWEALDAASVATSSAAAVQLWPEHFDAGTAVAVGSDAEDRCNLGVSPGDGFSDEPYVYVGPWGTERPGDAGYWNAPFGAVLQRSSVLADTDPIDAIATFFRRGIELLSR